LSGSDSYRDIVRFAKGHLKKLKELFGINWKHAPSKSVLRDIFCGIDKPKLEKAFRAYSQVLSEIENVEVSKEVFSIDGKALRGSFEHIKENEMLHLLSVFCTNNQLILGHVEMPEKTNEIPTAQALIKEWGLAEGSVYTLDAMHCQKNHLRRSKK
jgi:DDE_Tnp_1-associated